VSADVLLLFFIYYNDLANEHHTFFQREYVGPCASVYFAHFFSGIRIQLPFLKTKKHPQGMLLYFMPGAFFIELSSYKTLILTSIKLKS